MSNMKKFRFAPFSVIGAENYEMSIIRLLYMLNRPMIQPLKGAYLGTNKLFTSPRLFYNEIKDEKFDRTFIHKLLKSGVICSSDLKVLKAEMFRVPPRRALRRNWPFLERENIPTRIKSESELDLEPYVPPRGEESAPFYVNSEDSDLISSRSSDETAEPPQQVEEEESPRNKDPRPLFVEDIYIDHLYDEDDDDDEGEDAVIYDDDDDDDEADDEAEAEVPAEAEVQAEAAQDEVEAEIDEDEAEAA